MSKHHAASAPSAPDSDTLLRQGQVAQDEFDYEGAQALYLRALDASRGAPPAALALLTLLVDNLAADGDVLRAWPSLSLEAQALPELRVLGGLAAARAGQPELALRLVKGVSHLRAAEVHAQLVQDACDRGALDEAARHLAQAREQDPIYPELPRLTALLRARQEDARLPMEVQLLDLAKGVEHERAEALARQILSSWPDSDVARRLLAELQERRRTDSALRLLAQAEAAVSASQRTRAVALLNEVLVGEPPPALREQIQARLQRLVQEEQVLREAQRVEACAALLSGESAPAGLLAYLALPPSLRATVRERRTSPALALLEELGARATSNPRAAVEAVLALGRAQTDEMKDAPVMALQLLHRHQRFLEHLAAGRSLRHNIEEALATRAREQARAVVAAATAAQQRGESEQALMLLGGLHLRDLGAEEQRAAELLREAVSGAIAARQGIQLVAALLEAGEALAARALAEQLGTRASAADRPVLDAQLQVAEAAVRREFQPCGYNQPPSASEALGLAIEHFQDHYALLPNGDLLIARAYEHWLFLWTLDTDSGAVRRRAHLITPKPLSVLRVEVRGQTLWLLGHDGGALQIGWPDLTILRWLPSSLYNVPEASIDTVRISPDGSRLWVAYDSDGSFDLQVRVVDLERPQEHRDLGYRSEPWPIPAAPLPLMACAKDDDVVYLYDSRGGVVWTRRLPEDEEFRAAVVHPSGAGVLVLTAVTDEELGWIEVSSGGEPGPVARIAGSNESLILVHRHVAG